MSIDTDDEAPKSSWWNLGFLTSDSSDGFVRFLLVMLALLIFILGLVTYTY